MSSWNHSSYTPWFIALSDTLNNPDKHRRLHPLRTSIGIGHIFSPLGTTLEATLAVRLEDETNIIQALEGFISNVTSVLDEFKPEFQTVAQ